MVPFKQRNQLDGIDKREKDRKEALVIEYNTCARLQKLKKMHNHPFKNNHTETLKNSEFLRTIRFF